jgi:hypothetical protein
VQKIPSLFKRNYEGNRLIYNEVTDGCEWVQQGFGTPTRKWDGTCCLVREGKLYKRYDAKAGRTPPDGFIPAQREPDPVTGHYPGWLLVGNGPDDKCYRAIELIDLDGQQPLLLTKFSGTDHLCAFVNNGWIVVHDGTYELCGPKINGNPEGFNSYVLIRHGKEELFAVPRDFDGLREYLADHDIEGIVWHYGDRMAKVKAKDFGIKRGGK